MSNYADAGVASLATQSFTETPLFSGEAPVVTTPETGTTPAEYQKRHARA